MQAGGEPSSKKVRGSYSRLICLQCRARKIKCHLPADTAPSDHAQPAGKACERCKQFGLDCIVSASTLGRPALKRQRQDESAAVQDEGALTSTMHRENRPSQDESAGIEGFLLARQLESASVPFHPQQTLPSKLEIYESLSSPVHLLSLLLSRDERFASSNTTLSSASGHISILEVVSDELAKLLDQQ